MIAEPDDRPLFASATALEAEGRYDEAWAAYLEANRQARAALPARSNPAGYAARMDEIIALMASVFTPDFMRRWQAPGPALAPIFIVGMPRSGSTLVEQILASHPRITALGETLALAKVVEPAYPLRLLGPAPVEHFATLRRAYLQAIGQSGGARFTDKTLWNYCVLGIIRLMFPKAVIIETVRDVMDTCVSCFRTPFSGQAFASDLADIGAEYVRYRKSMGHWRGLLRVEVVEYEALVADFEPQVRRLLDVCGLAWDERCLRYYETDRNAGTASKNQVRQPIFTDSVGRWRRYEAHLGPLTEALGAYAAA